MQAPDSEGRRLPLVCPSGPATSSRSGTLRTITGSPVRLAATDRLVHLQFRRYATCPVCNLLAMPHGGVLGLPADFLISPGNRVLARKYGTHAYDQWPVDELLEHARLGWSGTVER